MAHVDALNRHPLPTCLNIKECSDGLLARLRKAQIEDVEIQKIVKLIEQGKTKNYSIQGDLLFKEIDGYPRLIVPTKMQSQIIRNVHERGHFSVAKPEAFLKQDYWMTNMQKKIGKVIQNCISCILTEKKQGKQEGFLNSLEKGSLP